MDREIDQMARTMSFNDEEEQGLIIPDELWPGGPSSYALTLVCRVVTNGGINFEALSTTFIRAAMSGKGMEFSRVGSDRFLLTFQHRIDKRCILEGGPWNFENYLIVFGEIGSHDDPATMALQLCDFTVHVSLDVQKPLLRGTKIRTADVWRRFSRSRDEYSLWSLVTGNAENAWITFVGSDWGCTSFLFLKRPSHFWGFSSPSVSIRPHVTPPNEALSPGLNIGNASRMLPILESPIVQSTIAPSVVGESLVNISLVFSTPSNPNQGCSSSSIIQYRGRRGRCATSSRLCTGRKRRSVGGIVIASSPKRTQSNKVTSSSPRSRSVWRLARPFRFEYWLLRDPDCGEVVSEGWFFPFSNFSSFEGP
ncbi:hypothetical protein Salat_0634900 [Sesamum alatum]|uniref:DUF4283 domain-containing protein n=1 Tax=Sesamum alatum TaxID=300844 RepID=A0AAE2CU66_9LAMI|nr:hypothetical protein Salat_0634900 [Sesamum alatum]